MKILMSVYACEPNKGSEPGVGWNMVVEIAKYQQVWAFTSNTHRNAIEAELAARPVPNLNLIYFDPFCWVYDWSQEGKRPQWNVQIHYYLWQIWAYFIGRSLHRQIAFDLIHHVTYVKYSSPSFLCLLPIPFIWGPVGGGESAPKPFWQDFGWKGKIYEIVRLLARHLGELDPFVHLTARHSIIAWATTEDTAKRMRKIGAKNTQILSQIGLLSQEIEQLGKYSNIEQKQVRFISTGRLLHWKGFYLGLRAFARAALPEAEYWIVGDGPERQRLEYLAQELGISPQVKFWGRLSRNGGLDKLEECHVLVHPSLHDSGGLVCLEAMASGRPVICLDLGGPGIQVTAETGFKIPAHTPDQAVQGLAEAMTQLAKDSNLRIQMGNAGKSLIAKSYNWEAKAKALTKAYEEVVTPLGNNLDSSKLINDQFAEESSPR
ncbi:glycosyltransferase family 4 protein [Brunnivagina elsteri]|uniref:Glycosyl transferase family 1 n=1 Tax=Brunnivagina elsteri CCALA 953 TaxID=987040 RepID=A0A2A2TJK6_9CYAN|nr:glycosyltransferase [Calothrix elsteri]PAX54861.1 glycosyl transferase family 1 [Calothrix elsteri CCALA 953]